MRQALLASLNSDLDSAEQSLSGAIAAGSTGPDAYLALAALFRERGEIGRAISVHQTLALRHDLNDQQRLLSQLGLAADFSAGGFDDRALEACRMALALDASNAPALRAMVDLLTRSGDWRSALKMLRRWSRVTDRQVVREEAAILLAWARDAADAGRKEKAYRLARRALRRNPSSSEGLLLISDLDAKRGRWVAAMAGLLKVIESDPAHAPSAYARMEELGKASDGGQEYERVLRGQIDKRPDDTFARLCLARRLAATNREDEAVSGLRRLLDRDPKNISALVDLGEILLDDESERGRVDALKGYSELLAALSSESSGGGDSVS